MHTSHVHLLPSDLVFLSSHARLHSLANIAFYHRAEADYFYFMDGDVRFNEDVLLGDVSGDMVAVEHPMYPRHDTGWCVHGKVRVFVRACVVCVCVCSCVRTRMLRACVQACVNECMRHKVCAITALTHHGTP